MERLHIQARERTPEVDFRFEEQRFSLRGESYPEDAPGFFGPLLRALGEHCSSVHEGEVVFEIALTYFNTSSAKFLMNLFQALEDHGKAGAKVRIVWHHHADDEMMSEFGRDFSEDLRHVRFELHETAG